MSEARVLSDAPWLRSRHTDLRGSPRKRATEPDRVILDDHDSLGMTMD